MNRKTLLQEGRTQKFLDVLGRGEAWPLSALKAAELLGMNERSFGRYPPPLRGRQPPQPSAMERPACR